MDVKSFVEHHYRHFNAASLRDAARGYVRHLDGGGRMLVSLAGAMSTAELGVSLAEMIREDKVHAVVCTGANLEEDVFNLVAHRHYRRIPDWRNLTPKQEKDLELAGLNRVTDTCIPESEAFAVIEYRLLQLWREAEAAGERLFPHEFIYRLVGDDRLADSYQIDPAHSWILAAAERNLPLFVPGWEDSTLGNGFAARILRGELAGPGILRGGVEYLMELADWYVRQTLGRPLSEIEPLVEGEAVPDEEARTVRPEDARCTVGFFQIGGGIAGDFAICVVPMIHQDLARPCPYWGYFCQIGDSTTSYGSYSGAIPTEKITWGKLDVDTPKFMIESDATIVAPLIFNYVLGR